MNVAIRSERHPSTCPHDCPSVCALDVEVIDGHSIGRVRGAKAQSYTAGVICAKVARYAERLHHPDRLLYPLRRTGPKGSGLFARVTWDEALDTIAHRVLGVERDFGAESVWPYFYAGTMGRVMRDGLKRLTHAKKYSRIHHTICTTMSWTGFVAGTGRLAGPDPREMARADCVVIWGTNAVATQVNVMTHAMHARKERGAKIVVVDIYRNATMDQADLAICLRPGSDGALACAVMHILFRDGLADRGYLARYTDVPEELEAHLATRTPEWAAAITGLDVAEITAMAHLVGTRKKTYFRLGYGFTRQRNGTANMHAASCIAAVTGAWQYEGGGAFHSNNAIYRWRQTLIEGADVVDPYVRTLDQSRIGAILTGDAEALRHGAPVKAMLIQNTNPVSVAPDQTRVKAGFAREDLFVMVHEQFMTETAAMADIVLPATMFLEHDDIYLAGGHQHISLGGKLVEPPGECRSNHEVHCALAERLGAQHVGLQPQPTPADRRCAPRVGLAGDRCARPQDLGRCTAAVRDGALSRRLRLARWQVPVQAGLAECANDERRPDGALADHALPAGPLGRDGGRRCRSPLPPRDKPGAQLSKLHLQRDLDIAFGRRAAKRQDASA